MIIAKQMEIRSDIKKYFDMAFEGEAIVVPRKQSKNVVIISEDEYKRLTTEQRMVAYETGLVNGVQALKGKNEGKTLSIKEENMKKLDAIERLKDNWNGNGAPALSKDVVEKVRKLIDKLPVQPEIFPTAMGTIQLEFDNYRRDHMEIEVGESKVAEIFAVSHLGVETEESFELSAKNLKEKVLEFYG